ncbi:hypothetical protein [Priestia taiwanensis]|uniref:RNA polymerase subunit sigma-70 n=1 Tax=Priestia taiwanensis TaxID=1347902 RepID=A0A917AUE2_9BACI|nr:hypothetical protein [Priestia taiwanensis]MBM7363650.1 putative NAD-dependent epimerase/dehydratase family protein [Priestia taiwanensis]GGE75299.1 hypothetical protein GCM10007140_26370 [Priestia taiwanensis]
MRTNNKGQSLTNGGNQLFDVSFHDFLAKEQSSSMIELASEFGLSLRDVQKLKKQLERS